MTKLDKERFVGSVFSRDEVDKLQEILNLKTHDEALAFAGMITAAVVIAGRFEEGSRRVPDKQTAHRNLKAIFSAASDLAQLLSDDPGAELLLRSPVGFLDEPSPETSDECGRWGMWRAETKRRLEHLISDLKTISLNADRQARDDELFRGARWLLPRLPKKQDPAYAVAVRTLWPILLEIWLETGHKPAATENGPTHRFIKFVHEALGLSEPSASTLADAIAAFNHRRRTRQT